jgi:twitching motility protein PilT
MQTFDQHLMELYEDGQLKMEVAKAAASNPEDFERGLTYE